MNKLDSYKSFIFDCDGVILNSNKIKSNAFYEVASKYGKKEAKKLVNYHINKGGISRYKKFEYFSNNILLDKTIKQSINELCKDFSDVVLRDLNNSQVNTEIFKLKDSYPKIPWSIVSGGDQEELRSVFKNKEIDKLFDGGIYGSPMDKVTIFKNLCNEKNMPAIYFGDSKYDFLSSTQCNIDFCFVSMWTEVKNWRSFCYQNNINYINNFSTLI